MNKDRHVHFAKSQSDEILRLAASIVQIHSKRGHRSQTFVATRNHASGPKNFHSQSSK